MSASPKSICVYCASSQQSHPEYIESARRLGRILAEADITVVYGGGGVGSMGALADGALEAGGRVLGIIPEFMQAIEWGHTGVTELCVVETMHARKQKMIEDVDAVVALPGGCGTFEELLEAITWKRLGLYHNPIIIANIRDYYAPMIQMLERSVAERFLNPEHERMWSIVDSVEAVLPAIASAPLWTDAQKYARV
jgi:hypothetical protein